MIEFRVLGPLQMVVEEAACSRSAALKQRGVLALLLLARNRVVPRDRLVDALWGDEPPASAANSVQVYVSKLRKTPRRRRRAGLARDRAARLRPPRSTGDARRRRVRAAAGDGLAALRARSFAEAESLLARARDSGVGRRSPTSPPSRSRRRRSLASRGAGSRRSRRASTRCSRSAARRRLSASSRHSSASIRSTSGCAPS